MTTPRKRTTRTRRPPSIAERVAERIAEVEDDYAPEISPPNVNGCLVPILFVMMLGLIGFLVYERIADRRSPDTPSPVAPVNVLSEFTGPIAAKLSTDRGKAAIVADAYAGLCMAIAGKTGERITSSRIFEASHAAFLRDIDAMGGVAVGAEIDQAIGGYLGMTKATGDDPGWEPIAFDATHRAKLVEITAAIAEVAEAAK